jgi:uncharacterized protein (TIGR02118 family)
MARLLVIYRTPKDAAPFDRYYADTHVPLAKNLPRLGGYEISRGPAAAPGGASGVHLVASLDFDSVDAISAVASPKGKAAAGDLANFADGGIDLYTFETTHA